MSDNAKVVSPAVTPGAGPVVSTDCWENVERLLAPLGPVESAGFLVRAHAAVGDVSGAVAALYGADRAGELLGRFLHSAAVCASERSVELRISDAKRLADPTWFQQPDRLGYVAYCERFGPTIADVEKRVPYLDELGVTYFHLMKVIEPRPEPNDGGFAVANYRKVDPTLGTNDDLQSLAQRLRDSGISLCVDLVMNHTAREHVWAEAARRGDIHKRAYYMVYPDRVEPDEWEQSLPEVFPEIAPGNFTWDADLNGWVWTTFNHYQWDLNYANPDVLVEMLDNILFLANLGIDVMRLDAVAFTWKRKGTNCQNQPEAHLIAQVLRAFTSLAAPTVLLKAEAIVGPRDMTTYLGAFGAHGERPECQLAYHNQLMVMIWSALASRDAIMASHALRRLAPTPKSAGWATYVRCHDDIGWAVDDEDARVAGIDPVLHRKFLADFYRGDFPGSFAAGASFSVNEKTGDERTCGSTASLAGLQKAIAANDPSAIDAAIQRIVLAYGLVASFGMPLIYMGDELGMLNDLSYLDDPDLADDSRWMQRPAMDWSLADRSAHDNTPSGRIRRALMNVFAVRARTGALLQGGDAWILDVEDPRVLAFGRFHPRQGRLLGLANFAEVDVTLNPSVFDRVGLQRQSRNALATHGAGVWDGRVHVPALSLSWFTDSLGEHVVPFVPGN